MLPCNTKQKTDRRASQDNESAKEKSQGPEKWKLTEIIVCNKAEYATDNITDNLNKTISQEVPWTLLINRCTLV